MAPAPNRAPGSPTNGKRARAGEIVDRLERAMPDVRIALEFQDDVAAARLGDPLGAEHGRRREPRDAGAVRAVPRRRRLRRSAAPEDALAVHPEPRPLPQQGEGDRRGDAGRSRASTAAACRGRARRSRRCPGWAEDGGGGPRPPRRGARVPGRHARRARLAPARPLARDRSLEGRAGPDARSCRRSGGRRGTSCSSGTGGGRARRSRRRALAARSTPLCPKRGVPRALRR